MHDVSEKCRACHGFRAILRSLPTLTYPSALPTVTFGAPVQLVARCSNGGTGCICTVKMERTAPTRTAQVLCYDGNLARSRRYLQGHESPAQKDLSMRTTALTVQLAATTASQLRKGRMAMLRPTCSNGKLTWGRSVCRTCLKMTLSVMKSCQSPELTCRSLCSEFTPEV